MLDNQMKIDQIDLSLYRSAYSLVMMRQEEYDLLQTKDPYTIYRIIDSSDGRCYYGDALFIKSEMKPQYMIGPSDTYGEYTMYYNQRDDHGDNLIEICRYKDPQRAIDDLNSFNRIGSHTNWARQCYNVIASYLTKDITLNNMMIGIIALFGYRKDIRFQQLIETVISLEADKKQNMLPILLIDELPHLKKDENHLYKYYSDLYDLTVYYDNFKASKFHPRDPEELNLSEVINRVFRIFTDSIIHQQIPLHVKH